MFFRCHDAVSCAYFRNYVFFVFVVLNFEEVMTPPVGIEQLIYTKKNKPRKDLLFVHNKEKYGIFTFL